MSPAALAEYIARLPRVPMPGHRIWLNAAHQAQGRYFNCTLTSVFQPLRRLGCGDVLAHEAFIRSAADGQPGLSVWGLLEGAASDEESIGLDRLCRLLHAINFFRQQRADGADLYLSVHERLLAAVSNNHGMVFRRVLETLGLPLRRIVLQLPQARSSHRFLLQYVADNYQRSGFRVALNVADATEGLRMLQQMRPDAIKVDARALADTASAQDLAQACAAQRITLVFKRVDKQAVVDALLGMRCVAMPLLVQGRMWDEPETLLHARETASADVPVLCKERALRRAPIPGTQ